MSDRDGQAGSDPRSEIEIEIETGTGTGTDVDGYLARIGAARPRRADAATLAELQRRHLHAVPFENLSVHLGEDITLDRGRLVDKVVRRRRGGFCYELNGAFATLLGALGYRVTLIEARVIAGGEEHALPYDHLTLSVLPENGSGPWLTDVGFGEFSERPLRLDRRGPQRDPAGVFEIVDAEHGDVVVLQDGAPKYRVSARPRKLSEFVPTCWYHRSSPDSHFTQKLVCTRLTDHGRITLSGRKLKETVAGESKETQLPDEAAVLDAYRHHFGIELDREPLPGTFGTPNATTTP